MPTLDEFYWQNPIATIDRNSWALQYPEVQLQFRNSSVYTPLVDWTSELTQTNAKLGALVTELIEGETDANELPFMAQDVEALGVDSRTRTFGYGHFGGKVQLNRKSNIFNQWKVSGGKDWKPLLRNMLGQDIIRKHEILSRNIHLKGPRDRWTYGGNATSIGTIDAADKFQLESVIDWNFRLGQYGSPLIPGDSAAAKLAIIPPGVTYQLRKSLASATTNEAQMWRDARTYSGEKLNYEIGEFSGVRFQSPPSDRFGINPAVLYNAGAITKQYGVTAPINPGDGAPDPDLEKVDEVFMVGQKNVTHYIQLEDFAEGDFNVNDFVSIHAKTTDSFGTTGGVDFMDGRTIVRRVIKVDFANNRLVFDRPVLFPYTVAGVGKSVTGNTDGAFYAFVTSGRHIGMCLVMGSRGGTLGAVAEQLAFYEPQAVDTFQQIWRFAYDMTLGYNIWDPNLFEVHFCSVAIPKPGGVIE
jgi:hypothetical protein